MSDINANSQEEQVERVKQRRLRPDARREVIVTSSAAYFIETGSFDLTMTAIAKAIGISRNLVYHYFQNLESLIEGVIDYETAELERLISDLPIFPPKDAIERVVRTYIDYVLSHTHGLISSKASPELTIRLKPYAVRIAKTISQRCANIYQVQWEGPYRAALLAAVDFMVTFIGTQADRLSQCPDVAVKTCVDVFERSMSGAHAASQLVPHVV